MSSKIYSVATAAKELNISDSLMRYYVREGRIKSRKILTPDSAGSKFKYVITEEALLEFMKLPKRKRGIRKSSTMIGPYRITRVNGELVTERVG